MNEHDWDEHYAEMHSSNMGGFVAGLVVGALAGAATMLLMAPASGEATRQMIGEKTTHLKERVAETAEEARQRALVMKDEVAGRVEKLQHRGQEVLEEQRARVAEAVQAGRQAVQRR